MLSDAPHALHRNNPADHLAGILSQTLDRDSALATRQRLHEAAGLSTPDRYLEREDLGLELGR